MQRGKQESQDVGEGHRKQQTVWVRVADAPVEGSGVAISPTTKPEQAPLFNPEFVEIYNNHDGQ